MIDFEKQFRASYDRVLSESTSRGNEFFDAFYDRFIASSPLIAEKFSHTDMMHQKIMLRHSLSYLLNLFSTKKIHDQLIEIAEIHDRDHHDIPPELYNCWLDCLVETVREFDKGFDEDVELAWRMICSQGIAFMVYRYSRSKKKK